MLQDLNIFSHEKPTLIRVSFATYILGTLFLPLFGLVTCVFISFFFHFEDSIGTHCQVICFIYQYMNQYILHRFEAILICLQVPNYLPSISASISLSPESHIWRFCIGLHSAPRFLVAFAYFRFYKARFASRFPENPLSCVNLAFSVCENLGLLLLTYVSSSETFCRLVFSFVLFLKSLWNAASFLMFSSCFVFFCSSVVHKGGFVLFIISSLIHMLTTCRLWKSIKKYSLSKKVRNIKSATLII